MGGPNGVGIRGGHYGVNGDRQDGVQVSYTLVSTICSRLQHFLDYANKRITITCRCTTYHTLGQDMGADTCKVYVSIHTQVHCRKYRVCHF